MESIVKRAKKGQGTLALVTGTVVAFLVMIVIIIAVLLATGTLQDSNIFTSGSAEETATNELIANTTSGIAEFGGNIPTVYTVLGVLLIIGVIVLLIVLIRRAQGTIGGGGAL